MTKAAKLAEAIALLGAEQDQERGGWLYHAEENGEWWLVDEADLLALSNFMHDDDEHAYSHWCEAGYGGELI